MNPIKSLIAVSVFAIAACNGPRLNEGEDLFKTNSTEADAMRDNLAYIKDERTGLCFAVLNNHTDGFRSTFSFTCVPCDSLKRVEIK